jgi:hypothetical protein
VMMQTAGQPGTTAAAAAWPPLTASQLGVKNVHALRILFNCAYRLADVLGTSWVLVVEVLCALDRKLQSTWQPGGGGGGGGGSSSSSSGPVNKVWGWVHVRRVCAHVHMQVVGVLYLFS